MKRTSPLRYNLARFGRRLTQLGFLILFLYPLWISVYQRLTFNASPVLTSWLLPWDPGMMLGQTLSQKLVIYWIGMPLLLLASSLFFGRAFCGWVCPLGTLLDFLRPLAFWQHKSLPTYRNSRVRFYLLVVVMCSSLVSLKILGIFDPLVIFNRTSVSLATNAFSARLPGLRATLTMVSLAFFVILALDWWQPRFWCRNLCPVGALISLISRFSLLRRWVDLDRCTGCRQCMISCELNAINDKGILTDYAQCTFCAECQLKCPHQAIQLGFIKPVPHAVPAKNPVHTSAIASITTPLPRSHRLDRRAFLGAFGSGVLGTVIGLGLDRLPSRPALRPPGALPENEFLQTCILCQECIRVCPTGGLRPAVLENGLNGLGAPVLAPRQGGCSLNPSCPQLCAQVCPVGAIQPISKTEMKIGVAVVDRFTCLAWDQGAKCLVCVEACLNSAAIPFNGRVTVDPNRCTGCGRCESGCPVPGGAIHVRPIADSSD
ncbi:MAG TPA: 4Fe-4S binding protein [Anaerolineaceae bacterium]|nr:4Fe-4S binding protein [Anaerolineaceae bacterium]